VGEVYRPEDIVSGKKRSIDLSTKLQGIPPPSMHNVIDEIKLLRTEVNKIKQVLRTKGITIE
jgi:hypothetical protein